MAHLLLTYPIVLPNETKHSSVGKIVHAQNWANRVFKYGMIIGYCGCVNFSTAVRIMDDFHTSVTWKQQIHEFIITCNFSLPYFIFHQMPKGSSQEDLMPTLRRQSSLLIILACDLLHMKINKKKKTNNKNNRLQMVAERYWLDKGCFFIPVSCFR